MLTVWGGEMQSVFKEEEEKKPTGSHYFILFDTKRMYSVLCSLYTHGMVFFFWSRHFSMALWIARHERNKWMNATAATMVSLLLHNLLYFDFSFHLMHTSANLLLLFGLSESLTWHIAHRRECNYWLDRRLVANYIENSTRPVRCVRVTDMMVC